MLRSRDMTNKGGRKKDRSDIDRDKQTYGGGETNLMPESPNPLT